MFVRYFYLLLLVCFFMSSGRAWLCKCCYKTGDVIEFSNNKYYKVTYNNNGDEIQKSELETLQDFIDNIVLIIKTYNKGEKNTLLLNRPVFGKKPDETLENFGFGTEFYKILLEKGYSSFSSLSDVRLSSVIGCMLGMAIGDSVGAPYEFNSVTKTLYDKHNYTEEFLNSLQIKENWFAVFETKFTGQWTDDTSMGLCLADSLIFKKGKLEPLDVMRRFLAWWYCAYNNASRFENAGGRLSWGLGGNIDGSFKNFLDNPTLERTTAGNKYTSGNGSIMRTQSYITHQGTEAAECCKLLTFICRKFIDGEKKDNMKDSLNELLKEGSELYKYLKLESVKGLAKSQINIKNPKDNIAENWVWKADVFQYNEQRVKDRSYPNGEYIGSYAMDCMAMALHILYHTTSFEQAITVASKLCGDADTVAAVVGQMAGAFYGVKTFPQKWLNNLYPWDHGEIAKKALILDKINPK